ncbi:MAG: hypothetical protein KDE00_09970 [Rhodobacteraceae bacterium]|nr:hypothetical protein [Paracoccaceae bacterium]
MDYEQYLYGEETAAARRGRALSWLASELGGLAAIVFAVMIGLVLGAWVARVILDGDRPVGAVPPTPGLHHMQDVKADGR